MFVTNGVCGECSCPLRTEEARQACAFGSHYDLLRPGSERGTYYTYASCYWPKTAEEAMMLGDWAEQHKAELRGMDSPEALIAELREQVARRNRQIRDLRRSLRK